MTGPALTPAQAEALARGITGSRPAVAAVHDEIAARVSPALDDFKTLALGINDPVQAFAAVILAASAANPPWHGILLAELAAVGMIDLPAAMTGAEAAGQTVSVLPENFAAAGVAPQDFVTAMAPALGMADLLAAFNLSARRLCLVRVLEEASDKVASQGTGFLIGPHTVLTCWHVVAPLLDPATGRIVDGSAARLSCTFERLGTTDGRPYPVQEDWLVAFSPASWQRGDPLPHAVSPDGTFLDYCAIRLRGAPGRERGWYDLAATGTLDHPADNFFVFQHPAGVPQRAGFATGTKLDDDKNHLRHLVWTAGGSSGGLCLNNRLRPVAMHRASVTVRNGQGQVTRPYNLAVHLSAIHAAHPDLGAPQRGDPQGLNGRLSRLADGSCAVVGRGSTQHTLRRMAQSPDPAILIVQGSKDSGKSFSTVLLRDSLPIETRIIIELSATEMPAQAQDLARMILIRAGMPGGKVDEALTAPGSLTTAAATVAGIFNALKRELLQMAGANPAQPRTLWLVIDELDVARLPGIGARLLLDQIYSQLDPINGDPELRAVIRVVLIGLKDTLTGVRSELIGFDTLPDPARISAEEVENCLDGLTVDFGKVPVVGQSRRHAKLVLGAAEVLAEQNVQRSALALLSGYLSRVYMKALQEW